MSVNFTNLVAQPTTQLGPCENGAAESINIIPLTAIPPTSNGSLEGLHPEKSTIVDPSASREIVMHSTDANIDGMLDITIHHASDIHNICIYGKQDVYAKFSITQTEDTVYSTQPVRGGGKNPIFNQSLQILISKLDAVLKCELWMMSCARNYLEDQLLGFVLVPLCDLLGKGKLMHDYSLTSTELFHTPAGTVCLSLMFYKRCAQPLFPAAIVSDVSKLDGSENGMSSYSHTLAEEDRKHDNVNGGSANIAGKENSGLPMPVDYNSIEFPDLQVVSENQQLVSMYMKMVSDDSNMDDIPSNGGNSAEQNGVMGVFQVPAQARDHSKGISERHVRATGVHDSPLELGTSSLEGDCEMALDNGEEEKYDEGNGSLVCRVPHTMHMARNGALPSPMSKSSHQPNVQTRGASASKEGMNDLMKSKALNNSVCSSSSQATPSPTSISSGALSSCDDKTMGSLDGQESVSSLTDPPLVNISLDPEVPVVQQQIVDMYMKSMQQFTESLAKMKLPFDMEGTTQSSSEHSGEAQQPHPEKKGAPSEPVVKDGHRVFYGSRAFF